MKRTTKNYWKLLNAYLSTNVRLGLFRQWLSRKREDD